LPELQRIISSRLMDNPMMLWIEFQSEFKRLCLHDSPPIDLLARVWQYAKWCLAHGSPDVSTAAALGFCEHLLDHPACAAVLPKIMDRSDFLSIRTLLDYHNTPAEVDTYLQTLWQ